MSEKSNIERGPRTEEQKEQESNEAMKALPGTLLTLLQASGEQYGLRLKSYEEYDHLLEKLSAWKKNPSIAKELDARVGCEDLLEKIQLFKDEELYSNLKLLLDIPPR